MRSMIRFGSQILYGLDLSTFVEGIGGKTPLFIEESIRNLKAVGIPDTGSVGQGFKVPDSVQPLIAQRIDSLSFADRQILQSVPFGSCHIGWD